MRMLIDSLSPFWPCLAVIITALAMVWLLHWLSERHHLAARGQLLPLLTWFIASTAVIAVVILLPISDETQGQVLSLLGVVLTAVIALSSTTFVANAMAGIMLQASQSFRPGDYIRVQNQFGRVTRRALLHTQIQTEWRDLANLPNMFLVNNPVTVLHRDGTIISTEVSIGYDQPYTRVEDLLLRAGKEANLKEPFVLIESLLDHAIVYRVCGFLKATNTLLGARSILRKKILEQLHGNGIEIVSPSFMNQRRDDPDHKVIPATPVLHDRTKPRESSQAPQEKIFDKAEEAASLEDLKLRQEELRQVHKRERARLKSAAPNQRDDIESHLEELKQQEAWYTKRIEQQLEKE